MHPGVTKAMFQLSPMTASTNSKGIIKRPLPENNPTIHFYGMPSLFKGLSVFYSCYVLPPCAHSLPNPSVFLLPQDFPRIQPSQTLAHISQHPPKLKPRDLPEHRIGRIHMRRQFKHKIPEARSRPNPTIHP